MALPSVWWLRKLADAAGWLAPLAGGVLGLILFIFNVFTYLILTSLDLVFDLLATVDTEAFGNANFALLEWVGYINAVFPLLEALSLLGAYCAAWLSIITLRWVKSFIPTMAN